MPEMTLGRIDLGDVTKHNIKLMKRLNQAIFPVKCDENAASAAQHRLAAAALEYQSRAQGLATRLPKQNYFIFDLKLPDKIA